MARKYSVQITRVRNGKLIQPYDGHNKVYHAIGFYTGVAGELVDDVYDMMYLPQGARVLSLSKFFWSAASGAPDLEVGTPVHEDMDGNTIAASNARFMDADGNADGSSGAFFTVPVGGFVAGRADKNTHPDLTKGQPIVPLVITVTDAALEAAQTMEMEVYYSMA